MARTDRPEQDAMYRAAEAAEKAGFFPAPTLPSLRRPHFSGRGAAAVEQIKEGLDQHIIQEHEAAIREAARKQFEQIKKDKQGPLW